MRALLGIAGATVAPSKMSLIRNMFHEDGKLHVVVAVKNRRLSGGPVVQRQVLYLGEINASQREAWRLHRQWFEPARWLTC